MSVFMPWPCYCFSCRSVVQLDIGDDDTKVGIQLLRIFCTILHFLHWRKYVGTSYWQILGVCYFSKKYISSNYPSHNSKDHLLYVKTFVLPYWSKLSWIIIKQCAVGQSSTVVELNCDLHEIIIPSPKHLGEKEGELAIVPPANILYHVQIFSTVCMSSLGR